MDDIKTLGLLLKCADEADNLYDALFAQQDLWSDSRYREIHVAAVKVDEILKRLESETGYIRQENRA